MGWVGVGTLLATIAYLLYRYLPPSGLSSPLSAPPNSNSDAPSASPDKLQPNSERNPATPPTVTTQRDSPQNTPKALASDSSSPAPIVPTLNLEEASETPPVAKPPAQQSMNGSTPQVASSRNESTKTNSEPSAPRITSTSSSLMPPPPPPISRPNIQPNRAPTGGGLAPPGLAPPRVRNSPRTPLSSAASARLAPTGTGLSSSTLAPTPLSLKKSSASKRVILEPGYSPLDWAALAANPKNQLRGIGLPPGLLRVTPSMLKTQNGRKGRDAWTSYQGKVYNISPYLPYHPGGKGELLRGAGKDSAKLFQEIHPWVNWDGILGECLVGILVSENDIQAENTLDAMD